jgi:hypothetical protein
MTERGGKETEKLCNGGTVLADDQLGSAVNLILGDGPRLGFGKQTIGLLVKLLSATATYTTKS